jgi:hypothetical protein
MSQEAKETKGNHSEQGAKRHLHRVRGYVYLLWWFKTPRIFKASM